MTRQDNMTHSIAVDRADKPSDETVAMARRTVAEHALDAADLALLLDVLGIGPEAPELVEEPEEGAPQEVCECGCDDPLSCRRLIPVTEVHEVVDRIITATGWQWRKVAQRAGISPGCLKEALRRAEYVKKTARGNLERLRYLAAEVGA